MDERRNRSICPACGSWDKKLDKGYNVEHEKKERGLTGICLNPVCKAEWLLKISENINCSYCGTPLFENQKKYCSRTCSKKAYHKKKIRKKWRIIHSKIKIRKMTKKIRRRVLIEQEEKRRKTLI